MRRECGAGIWIWLGHRWICRAWLVPLRISSVSVQLLPGQVQLTRLRGHTGTIAVDGDYRYFADPERPDRMRLTIGEAQLENLERILLPTLSRRQGFLARALRLERARLPEWLKSRQIEGTVQIKNLLAGEASLGSMKAGIVWNGAAVRLNNVEIHRDVMDGKATVAVDLSGTVPQYKVTGQFTDIEYRNGSLDLEGVLQTSGLGLDAALHAGGEGTFTGTGITLSADTAVDEISGEFHLDPASAGPRLLLSKVQVRKDRMCCGGKGRVRRTGGLCWIWCRGGSRCG